MRIEVRRSAESVVRVITGVRVGRVSLLEGHNGIGKSSLIRLLQIATGTPAFADSPRSWESFRAGLGSGSLVVDELRGDHTIVWTFDSRAWPSDPREAVTSDWFESIDIDGTISSLDDVRRLFRVTRISGDTGIVETFAEELLVVRDQVNRLLAQADELIRDPLSTPGRAMEMLEAVVHLTESLNRDTLAFRESASDQLAELASTASRDAAEKVSVRDQLREAFRIWRELEELDRVAPDLDAKLKANEDELSGLETELAQVRSMIDAAIAASAAGEAMQGELRRAETNRRRNQKQLESATESLATALAVAGVENPSQVSARLADLRSEYQAWLLELSRADQTPATIELAKRAESILRANKALADQDILPKSFSAETTVIALADALRIKHAELTSHPGPPDVLELRARAQERAKVLSHVEAIPTLVNERDGAQRRVAEWQDKINDLAANEELAQADRLDELRAQEQTLNGSHTELVGRRAQLRHMRGMLLNTGDAAARRLELQRALDSFGVGVDELEVALADATLAATRSTEDANQATRDSENASEVLASTRAALQAAVDALSHGKGYEWIRRAPTGWIEPRGDYSPHEAIHLVEQLHTQCRIALDRITEYPNELTGLVAALDTVVGELRDPAPVRSEGRRYYKEVAAWAARHFGAYFDRESIKTALLSSDATEIEVDLPGSSVSWMSAGERVVRRLESFSSGQQAFAYARARVGMIDADASSADNHLICLDEFGAFMDANRRRDLALFLRERASEHPEDSLLLVLPLRRDFAEAAGEAVGNDRKRLMELDAQIRSDGFVIEDDSW